MDKWHDHGGLMNKVLKVRCTDDKWQKIEVDVLPVNPFASNPQLHASLLAYYEQNKGTIRRMIAKEMSEAMLSEALGIDGTSGGETGTTDDVAKFFG